MTGPEHYREAERLISAVTPGYDHDDGTPIILNEPNIIALAQVHATLALAEPQQPTADMVARRTIRALRARGWRPPRGAPLDETLIHQAIADPGAFLPRHRKWNNDYEDWDYESIPAWGARAVVAALDRAPLHQDDDYARDELYPQPGDQAGPLPPDAHGYPVGGRATHISGQHNWRDCPDLSGTEATS